MSGRAEVTGTLHVRRPRKSRSSRLFEDLIAVALEDGGLVERRYYPPMLYVTNDQTYDGEHPFIWKLRGVPRALADAEDGSTVTIRATPNEWANGIGCYLDRPVVLKIHPPSPSPEPGQPEPRE